MCNAYKVILAVVMATLSQEAPAAERDRRDVDLLTIVVLDTSGSMAGPRLAEAKRELLQKAEQLPPSPKTPWVLLPFNHEVHSARRFDSGFDEFAGYLKGLSAGGGTRIAAGLNRAVDGLERSNPRNTCVLLYTDGEDSDPRSVDQSTERLNRLFAQRSEHGLGSMVICKRWIEVRSDEDMRPIRLSVTPVLVGASRQAGQGMLANFQLQEPLKPARHSLPLYQPAVIEVALKTGALENNYFRDTVVEATVQVTAADPSVGIRPGQVTLRLMREAPCKRHLLALATAAFIGLSIGLPCWFLSRLRVYRFAEDDP